jgi:uncharacterized protein YjiS (DUF1127 family)
MAASNNIWRILQSQQQSLPAANTWLSSLHAILYRITSAWGTRRQQRRDAALLRTLSDRALRDIGLGRGDISRVVNGTYRRD